MLLIIKIIIIIAEAQQQGLNKHPLVFFTCGSSEECSCACASGVICTAKILDREKMPHYWLSVVVTDLGTEPLLSQTHVFLQVLDINDNAPQLSQPVYFASVQENVDSISSVARVLATDADASSEGKLSFHMLESHRTYFDVDPKTGNYR